MQNMYNRRQMQVASHRSMLCIRSCADFTAYAALRQVVPLCMHHMQLIKQAATCNGGGLSLQSKVCRTTVDDDTCHDFDCNILLGA